jgi:hypothetical protein
MSPSAESRHRVTAIGAERDVDVDEPFELVSHTYERVFAVAVSAQRIHRETSSWFRWTEGRLWAVASLGRSSPPRGTSASFDQLPDGEVIVNARAETDGMTSTSLVPLWLWERHP